MVQKKLEENLVKVITKVLQDFSLNEPSILKEISLDIPDAAFGDLSSNIAFKLTKSLKKAPIEIARDFVVRLTSFVEKDVFLSTYIEKISVAAAGFINFSLKKEFYTDLLKEILRTKRNFSKLNLGKNRKVQIEFVSANPTGPLSIAHARQAAIGDALCNLLRFFGYKVIKEYYINDEGNQINILAQSTQARLKELLQEPVEFKEEFYQGDYIYDIARTLLKDDPGKKDDLKFLADYSVKYLLDVIKKDLRDFGVTFDVWFSQRKLILKNVLKLIERLREKGYIYDLDAAVWFKSTSFGDDKDRVVVKNDNTLTYLAWDILYHENKFKRGFKEVIDIWGPDHHGYKARMYSVVQALGLTKEQLSILIIQLATIYRDGKPVSMSTRRGTYISLREVLDEVGKDAARFFFMMRRISSHLDFDLELAKRHSPENPVYYVQYAYARIANIIKNASTYKIGADLDLLKEPEELSLMRILLKYSYVLKQCVNIKDPCNITGYLQELAAAFHKFYDKHKVLVDEPHLRNARLTLIACVQIILSNSFSFLGISSPEKM
ncbi:MAG: arginine--tRNA ligase [Candidatus Gygaella obscura]|nr:arginine--tRNA ligase [Candidatus Gygaella obscura]